MASGFDRVSLFERILQLDSEFIDLLDGDTLLPVDTESVREKTASAIDSFEVFKI
jgi:hypothetical protein